MNIMHFGNSEAAITLAKMTVDKPNVSRGVTNILKYYRKHLHSTYSIRDKEARIQIIEFVYKCHLEKVDNTKRVAEVKTYVKNVMYRDLCLFRKVLAI